MMQSKRLRRLFGLSVALVLCCSEFGNAQTKQKSSSIRGHIIGKLELKADGNKSVSIIQVDGIDWKLVFDQKQVSQDYLKKLIGKTVLVVGEFKLSFGQKSTRASDGKSKGENTDRSASHRMHVDSIKLIDKQGVVRAERNEKAYQQCIALEFAVKQYMISTARWALTFDDLFKRRDDIKKSDWQGPYLKKGRNYLFDPWENMFWLKMEYGEIVITSCGPDGKLNTDDDITNTGYRAKRK